MGLDDSTPSIIISNAWAFPAALRLLHVRYSNEQLKNSERPWGIVCPEHSETQFRFSKSAATISKTLFPSVSWSPRLQHAPTYEPFSDTCLRPEPPHRVSLSPVLNACGNQYAVQLSDSCYRITALPPKGIWDEHSEAVGLAKSSHLLASLAWHRDGNPFHLLVCFWRGVDVLRPADADRG